MPTPDKDHVQAARQSLLTAITANKEVTPELQNLFLEWPEGEENQHARVSAICSLTGASFNHDLGRGYHVITMRDGNGYVDNRIIDLGSFHDDPKVLRRWFDTHFKAASINPGMAFKTHADHIDHLKINPMTQWALDNDPAGDLPRTSIAEGVVAQYDKGSNGNRKYRAVNGEFTVYRPLHAGSYLKHNVLVIKNARLSESAIAMLVGRPARQLTDHPMLNNPEVTIKRLVNAAPDGDQQITAEFHYPTERVGALWPQEALF